MTQTGHVDTTVGSVVSVDSVHVETGLRALSALTHWDILGACFAELPEAFLLAQNSSKPGPCNKLCHLCFAWEQMILVASSHSLKQRKDVLIYMKKAKGKSLML